MTLHHIPGTPNSATPNWPPIVGPPLPYYSHITSIRIPSSKGMGWEGKSWGPLEKSLRFRCILLQSPRKSFDFELRWIFDHQKHCDDSCFQEFWINWRRRCCLPGLWQWRQWGISNLKKKQTNQTSATTP